MPHVAAGQPRTVNESRVEIREERLNTDGPSLAFLMTALSPSERRRADAMRAPLSRAGFIQARAALRGMLAGPQQDPASIPLEQRCPRCRSENHGVVSLRGRRDVAVSLSHSARGIVVAVAYACGAVGVDCEANDAIGSGWAEIADRVFTLPERERIAASGANEDARVATQLWCRKEAVVKAARRGLLLSLRSFDVAAARGDAWTWIQLGGGGYYVRDLPQAHGCAAALAVASPARVVDRSPLARELTGAMP